MNNGEPCCRCNPPAAPYQYCRSCVGAAPRPEPRETRYAGCRFRSRLEARWAVAWDDLDLEWQYEPENFTVWDNTGYVPDFFLPQLGIWGEVKPAPFTNIERRKCAEVCRQKRQPVYQLVGMPVKEEYDAWYLQGSILRCATLPLTAFCTQELTPEQLENTTMRARSARFEHGESGAAPAPSVRLTGREFLDHFPQPERSTIANLFLAQIRRREITTVDTILAGVHDDVLQRFVEIRRWQNSQWTTPEWTRDRTEKTERLRDNLNATRSTYCGTNRNRMTGNYAVCRQSGRTHACLNANGERLPRL
jgi:hypothetical protein